MKSLVELNMWITTLSFEDTQRIEIWQYPPLVNSAYIDKWSLYLTLKNDNDPRVDKEIEIMMDEHYLRQQA